LLEEGLKLAITVELWQVVFKGKEQRKGGGRGEERERSIWEQNFSDGTDRSKKCSELEKRKEERGVDWGQSYDIGSYRPPLGG